MPSFDCSGIPRCTIDYGLEFTPEEIAPLSASVNTLLKSSFLLGSSLDTVSTYESLFDIAEEIASVDACGLLFSSEDTPRNWELKVSRRIEPSLDPERQSFLVAPAAIATHFGKAISMDPDWGTWSRPICEAWASRSLVTFPMHRDREVVGAIVFGKRESHPFTTVQVKLLWALSMQAETQLHRDVSVQSLTYYTFMDPLTHLYNRRFFNSKLDSWILHSRRTGEPVSLLMLDIDGFKAYNDRYLRISGDVALQEFAEIITGCVREVDTVARLDQDNFAVILSGSDAEGARELAKRITHRIHHHMLPGATEARTEKLSVSAGIASFPADSFDRTDLLAKSEQALRKAKTQGGGCIRLYHESATSGNGNIPIQELPVRKIYDAGRSVVDMDKFLEILLFTGMQGLGAGRGSIVVKDSSGEFSLRAAVGFSRHEEHIASGGILRPGLVTSWVVEHQIPLVVSTPDDSPLPPPKKKNGYSTDSFLSIPLTQQGRSLGALHLTNRKDRRPFTPEDLKIFMPIASEIAGILEQGMKFRENVRSFSRAILSSLSGALEIRYPFLSGHFDRVRDISLRVGQRMGLGKVDLATLRDASEFHDVGIVGVPGNFLSLKRSLNDSEIMMVRNHPYLGAKMLEGVPGLEAARKAILEHHEHLDGSGYPNGLQGEELSVTSRILCVAEFYDSVLSDRPYKNAMKPADVIRLVKDGATTLFDPDVVSAFMESVDPRTPTTANPPH